MKSLKIVLSLIALGLVASAPLQAQKKGQMSPEQQCQAIETTVGSLSADQKTQIMAIIEKSRDEMKGLSKDEKKEKGAPILKKQRGDIRAVLTDDQKAKYDAANPSGGKKGKKNQ